MWRLDKEHKNKVLLSLNCKTIDALFKMNIIKHLECSGFQMLLKHVHICDELWKLVAYIHLGSS